MLYHETGSVRMRVDVQLSLGLWWKFALNNSLLFKVMLTEVVSSSEHVRQTEWRMERCSLEKLVVQRKFARTWR